MDMFLKITPFIIVIIGIFILIKILYNIEKGVIEDVSDTDV